MDFVVGELGRHLTATMSTNAFFFFCTGDDSELTGLPLPTSLSALFLSPNFHIKKDTDSPPCFHFNSLLEPMIQRSI